MIDDLAQRAKPTLHTLFLQATIVAAIAATTLVSGCGQPSDSQPPAAQQQAADEQAWADAVRAGTAAAFTSYTQNFSSGAHVAEARARLAALEEHARKEADEKAWADAQRTGTTAAFTDYIQKFASGAHVAEAR